MSSNCVASVAYEPFAEELLLCGDEAIVRKLSDVRLAIMPEMALASPALFSNDGVFP